MRSGMCPEGDRELGGGSEGDGWGVGGCRDCGDRWPLAESGQGLSSPAKVTRLGPQLDPRLGILCPNLCPNTGLELEVGVDGELGFSPLPSHISQGLRCSYPGHPLLVCSSGAVEPQRDEKGSVTPFFFFLVR